MGLIGEARSSFKKIARWAEDYGLNPGQETINMIGDEASGADLFLMEQTNDS